MDCWGKEFIKGVTNTMDRQTESSMAGAVRRIQALAPEKDDQYAGASQERSRGVGRICVAGVASLLFPQLSCWGEACFTARACNRTF